MSGQCAVCNVQEMKDDETKTGCAMTTNLTGGQAGEARRGEANLREQEQMRAFAWMDDWASLAWRSLHSEQLAVPRIGWEYGDEQK